MDVNVVANTEAVSGEGQMAAEMDGNVYMKSRHLEEADPSMTYENMTLAEPPGRNGTVVQIPLIRPNPPRLSLLTDALADIERSGIFSNYGPVNSKFETQILAAVFNATGACVTVANATLGLMLAIKQAVGWRPRGRYALMPSFTFAATAQAALWCGLTPLFCDIDRETWLPDADAEDALLRQYGDEIAVLLPNATFGNCLDLPRYDRLSIAHGIPLVVDAAASLGSLNMNGEVFGLGSRHPLVFSMHATKPFATGEAGLVYCADPVKIAALRSMGQFGFNEARIATMPGLNAKLSEVAALLALTKLQDIEAISEHRFKLHQLYCSLLPGFTFQCITGQRSALQFVSVLLPEDCANHVPEISAELARYGIGSGRYFVPHLANHPFFQASCVAGDLGVTEEICRRVISLPMSDVLTTDEVRYICEIFRKVCYSPEVRRVSVHPAVTNTHPSRSLP
jgi:dTDP-4-amino-4,6-dideoxygalactose transaminase